MMPIKKISSGSSFENQVGYSRAVDDGQYVFVSGTTGYNYDDMTISDDVVVQAKQCFENIASALEQLGCSLNDVVRIRYIFPDRKDFEPCWPVLNQYLGAVKPAATLIIADLLDENMKLEIEVMAKSQSN